MEQIPRKIKPTIFVLAEFASIHPARVFPGWTVYSHTAKPAGFTGLGASATQSAAVLPPHPRADCAGDEQGRCPTNTPAPKQRRVKRTGIGLDVVGSSESGGTDKPYMLFQLKPIEDGVTEIRKNLATCAESAKQRF